jgi:hypothetical protein
VAERQQAAERLAEMRVSEIGVEALRARVT